MKKTIGILGGMGPLATADLYRKIVESTAAEGDRGHIRVYIDSNTAIPDRTAAILSGGPDPVPEMLSALRNLEKCGADCIIMPCNTAHYFLPRLRTQTVLPILDMPAITAQRCAELFPGKRACVLATKGTLRSGVYSRARRADEAYLRCGQGLKAACAGRGELARAACRSSGQGRGDLYSRLHRAADPCRGPPGSGPLCGSDPRTGPGGDPLLRL